MFAEDSKTDAEFGAALDTIRKKVGSKHAQLDASVREHLKPVKHSITVGPMH